MSYGTTTQQIHKGLRLDKRANSNNWHAQLTLPNGQRTRKSTKTDDFEDAKKIAIKYHYEMEARIANNLPTQTRKFKQIAQFTIKQMQDELDQGNGKQSYKDYVSAPKKWLISFFACTDVDKMDLQKLKKFDIWRTDEYTKPFSQSGINNHNAALNKVFDEAEKHGWIVKSMRPSLPNKGVKAKSRGSFTDTEYQKIYSAARTWHQRTTDKKASATREVLRNYILVLANTGIRSGTEALGLRWSNIEWQKVNGERYLVVNVDGKTDKRSAVARDKVEGYLQRQLELIPNLQNMTLEQVISVRSTEHVFTTRLGKVAKI